MDSEDKIVGLGARRDFVAASATFNPQKTPLSPDETAMLRSVGKASRIGDLIQQAAGGEARAIATLLSLRVKGAIVPAKVAVGGAASIDAAMSEEVDLNAERKREILNLEAVLDRVNYFELLGVSSAAGTDEIKNAYFEASRRYHPDRFFQKNLGSFRARVDRIFKRLTEAYTTLNSEESREAYLREHPELAAARRPVAQSHAEIPKGPADELRAPERRSRLVRHPYLAKTARYAQLVGRAKDAMERGDFALASADLQAAADLPGATDDVKRQAADAKKKHESTRIRAELQKGQEAERIGDLAAAAKFYKIAAGIDPSNSVAAYKAAVLLRRVGEAASEVRGLLQKAVEADPGNADIHALLGTVLLDLGIKTAARQHFEDAIKLQPEHEEARKQLRKMKWFF